MNTRIARGIKNLKEELANMGTLCEAAIEIAVNCAVHFDCSEINQVYELEREIDKLEKDIENKCMRLLLQQNPFASDFRIISAALKMISDFERIGDQALDIAELSKQLTGNDYRGSKAVKQMAQEVVNMLKMTVTAVVDEDADMAQEIIERDKVIDKYFDDVKCDIINLLYREKENGEVLLNLFLIAKYLERIGDHCTNLVEWLVYSITGHHDERKITLKDNLV